MLPSLRRKGSAASAWRSEDTPSPRSLAGLRRADGSGRPKALAAAEGKREMVERADPGEVSASMSTAAASITTAVAPPSDRRASSRRCSLRPVIVTRMPEASRRRAVARPIPEEPPMMTACRDDVAF